MSSAVLKAEGTKNKKARCDVKKNNNSVRIDGKMIITKGNNKIMFGRMIITKSKEIPNNVRTTFYDPNDIPKIEVNSQLDNRALCEYLGEETDCKKRVRRKD